MNRFLVLLFLCCAHVLAAPGEERRMAPVPTTLEAVMQSAMEHFPEILAAEAEIRRYEQLAAATQGAFDPRIDGSAGGKLGGYYDGQGVDAALQQTLPFLNARVFAGYRLSDGSFAPYDGADLTRDGGEARMGVSLSLLRDRDIDERRAAVQSARLDVLAEHRQLTAERLRVLQQAYVAYAQWLLAVRLQESYAELLAIAEGRVSALEQRVSAGDAAEILLVENRQAVLQRQGMVVEARRQVDMAAELLALYLRDAVGATLYPRYDATLELPPEDPSHVAVPIPQLLASVLERRPEIALARLAQEQAGIKRALADNLAKPRVDLRVYTSRDFGQGPATLAGTDQVAELGFSFPLRTREAEGKARAAQEEISSLGHRIRLLNDQVEFDLRRALVNLEATRQLEAYAVDELAMSEQLAAAERQRFDAGLSDFFLLNIRERQVGEAQLKRWQAHLAHRVALANFYVVSMNPEALGVVP